MTQKASLHIEQFGSLSGVRPVSSVSYMISPRTPFSPVRAHLCHPAWSESRGTYTKIIDTFGCTLSFTSYTEQLCSSKHICSINTVFKRCLSWQDFPQKDAEAVNIIFDCSWRTGVYKNLWCHISDCSTSFASDCLCCSLLLPFCQTKITYLYLETVTSLFMKVTEKRQRDIILAISAIQYIMQLKEVSILRKKKLCND